jgi:hypothetical protein
MNNTVKERIKNLAIQARREVKRPGVFTEAEFEQKFAELIVRECISELRDAFDMTIEEGNHLKEHFGVEE